MRVVHFFLPVLIASLFLASESRTLAQSKQFLGFPLDRSMRLSGLALTLSPDGKKDLGRVVFENVTVQSKKFGAFQVGVIPEVVVDGMRVEIPSGVNSEAWTENFRAILAREPLLRNARIQHFSMCDFSGKEILQARQARIAEGASSLNLEGIRTGSTNIRSASLALQGDQAGKLLCGPSRRPLTLTALIPTQQIMP